MLVAPLSHMISTEEMIKAILKHFLEVDLPGASFKGFGLGRRRFPTDLQQIDTRRQYKAFEMHTIYMIWKVAGTEPSSEPCSSTLPSWLNSRRRLVFIEHTFINRGGSSQSITMYHISPGRSESSKKKNTTTFIATFQ